MTCHPATEYLLSVRVLHQHVVLQVVLPEVPLAAGLTLEGSLIRLHCSLLLATDGSAGCLVTVVTPLSLSSLLLPLTHTALPHQAPAQISVTETLCCI